MLFMITYISLNISKYLYFLCFFIKIHSTGFPLSTAKECTRKIKGTKSKHTPNYKKQPTKKLTGKRFIRKIYGKWSNYEYGMLNFYKNKNSDLV